MVLSVMFFQSGNGFGNKNYLIEKPRQLGNVWDNVQESFLNVNNFNLNL